MLKHQPTLGEIEHQPIQEECGLVAAYVKTPARLLDMTLKALGGVQHRGQHGVGIASWTDQGLNINKRPGLIRDAFSATDLHQIDIKSRWQILHCRYGTNGDWQPENVQPIVQITKTGDTLVVAHNGQFVATHQWAVEDSFDIPDGASDTYHFSLLLKASTGKSWDQRVLSCLSQTQGAYSLAIGINDTLYVCRDKLGIRPLFLGTFKDGWLVASETHAFDKVGVIPSREVLPGEVLKINSTGLRQLQPGATRKSHFCDFEWAYFSRPDSRMPQKSGDRPSKWISMSKFRQQCGHILASESPISKASFVIGVPDSGISVGIGYAHALRLPYQQGIVRDHYDQNGGLRLFMHDNSIKMAQQSVLGKLSLIPDKSLWQDAIVVLADDSIVRGTVSAKITTAIKNLGAAEVHWIVGFPPVKYPCFMGVSMRSHDELIASKFDGVEEAIAAAIGADSVNYISNQGFIEARVNGHFNPLSVKRELFLTNGGCGGCVTGQYPITAQGEEYTPIPLRSRIPITDAYPLPLYASS